MENHNFYVYIYIYTYMIWYDMIWYDMIWSIYIYQTSPEKCVFPQTAMRHQNDIPIDLSQRVTRFIQHAYRAQTSRSVDSEVGVLGVLARNFGQKQTQKPWRYIIWVYNGYITNKPWKSWKSWKSYETLLSLDGKFNRKQWFLPWNMGVPVDFPLNQSNDLWRSRSKKSVMWFKTMPQNNPGIHHFYRWCL